MREPLPGDIVLRAGLARAVVRPRAGARVCELVLEHPDGHAVPILHPYTEAGVDAVDWGKGGIYPLAPYSNRIAHGRLRHAGGQVVLPPHPNAHPHSLHGHAHARPWALLAHDASSAQLRLDSPPCEAWPWHLQADLNLSLSASALQMALLLTHVGAGDMPAGAGDMPAGAGFHPYFLHRPDARLRYRAARVWAADADFLACASAPVQAADRFELPRPLPAGGLTDYRSEWDGALDLELPHGDVIHLHADPPLSHLVVHRPAGPLYLCLEPVSHVADGFNLAARGVLGTGCVLLPPGGQLQGRMTLRLDGAVF